MRVNFKYDKNYAKRAKFFGAVWLSFALLAPALLPGLSQGQEETRLPEKTIANQTFANDSSTQKKGAVIFSANMRDALALGGSSVGQSDSALPDGETSSKSAFYWLGILLLSLLGGMVLNVMPCTFPIFSLKLQKLLSLLGPADGNTNETQSANNKGNANIRENIGGNTKQKRRLHVSLLQTLLGIELSFLVLGVLMLLLWPAKSGLLWGFQLQRPLLVYVLSLLLFAMALSLLGFFRFGLPGWLNRWINRPGGSAFWNDIGHGFLVVALGTPCSAPLLGPVLGLFLLQDSLWLGLAGLLSMGLGLWAPYAILAKAMLRSQGKAKQAGALAFIQRHSAVLPPVLGFIMLGGALYFYWVLKQLAGPGQMVWAFWSWFLLCGAAWLFGHLQGKKWKEHKWISAALLCILLAFVWPVYSFVAGKAIPSGPTGRESVADFEQDERDWPRFLSYDGSPVERAAVETLRDRGYGIFIEYSAAWCSTCKWNQIRLLHRPRLRRFFEQSRILYLKADLTQEHPVLQAELNTLGRASVPVYLLYAPVSKESQKAQRPRFLPTLPSYKDFL